MRTMLVGVKLRETLFLERIHQIRMNFRRIFPETPLLSRNMFYGCYRIVFDTDIF